MSDCIFTFGKKDKKLLIPLIYLLANIFINIFETEYNIVDTYIENFAMSINGIFSKCYCQTFFQNKIKSKNRKAEIFKRFWYSFFNYWFL